LIGSAAIAGGGIGGLTAALALLRAGWRVRVYEQADTLGEVGAGITIASGTGRGLAWLGLEAALLAESLPSSSVAFVHYRTRALLAGAFDHGAPEDHGFATGRHIHRADLHRILLDAVRAVDPDCVRTGHRIAAFAQDGSGATARFANGAVARADLLIGADGARSVIRTGLFGDDAPVFSGQVAFRCLVPAEAAAPYMSQGSAVVSVGPARNFHRYPIRGGRIVNVIGMAQSQSWQQEGWNTRATTEDFLAEFGDFHDDVTGLIRQSPPDSLIKWGLFLRPPVPQWSQGRIVLLGDAAHPILPFLGLGAALAIEDAIVLTRVLSQAPTPQAAFAAYQATRAERVSSVRLQTIAQGEKLQASDPDRGLEGRAAPAAPFQYDPATIPLAWTH
jgi:salicylate hydroxylase